MGYIALIAVISALVFLIRLQMMRRQVKQMIDQLEQYRSGETKMKLAISLTDKLLESLSSEINQIIDLEVEAEASRGRVDRELKEAISGMSHDLRTPLTAIIGYMQLVEQADLPDEERERYLKVAQQRTLRLQQLIQNFFSLSIVEANDYPLQMQEINLTSLVKDMLLSYYDQFQVKNEQPDIHISEEPMIVFADQIACKRVIENMLLNVIQHAEGGIGISLYVDESARKAIFSVQNKVTNANIQTDRLFDKFYTADQTRKYSGGLGLAIVKSLMEKMNGTVDVRMDEGVFEVMCGWETVK